MPQLFTHTWAVVGGGSLAVLLLAILHAPPREQEPTDPVPDDCRLPISPTIRRRIAAVLGVPLAIVGLLVLWRGFRVLARRYA